jgi:hypothetical protein
MLQAVVRHELERHVGDGTANDVEECFIQIQCCAAVSAELSRCLVRDHNPRPPRDDNGPRA